MNNELTRFTQKNRILREEYETEKLEYARQLQVEKSYCIQTDISALLRELGGAVNPNKFRRIHP